MHKFRYKKFKFKHSFIEKFKHLIDDIVIHYLFSKNFASIEDLRKKKVIQL